MENSNQEKEIKISSLDAIINSLKCISNKLDERDAELGLIIDKLVCKDSVPEDPDFSEKVNGVERMPEKSIPVIENIIFNIEDTLNKIFHKNMELNEII